MTAPIRVVIAEDHYLVREGTRQLLELAGDIEVVASVADAAALVDAVDRLEPDAVVADIRMPPNHQTEGIDAAHQIRARHPDIGVVILSQYANALYAFELFRDGTDGLAYLLKDRVGDVDELRRAVAAVVGGGSVIDPLVVEGLIARGEAISNQPALGRLTERERAVLQEMAQGKSNSSIAETLHISASAVEKHINAILTKLDLDPQDSSVNRRVAAVLKFLRSYTPSQT